MTNDLCINTLKRAGFPECAAHVEKLVERLEYDGTHSCHQDCQQTACVLRRRVEEAREALELIAGEHPIARRLGYKEVIELAHETLIKIAGK